MKSNEIYDKRNGTTVRYDRNSLRAQLRDETKTDSSKIHVVSKSVANDHAVDNRAKEQQSAAHDGPMRKSSNYDNESKKAQGKEMQKCDDSIDSRYQLNSRNYVMELHRALIKECKDNVIDFNAIHITLDSETLNNVTHQAFKAVKVRPQRQDKNNLYILYGYYTGRIVPYLYLFISLTFDLIRHIFKM